MLARVVAPSVREREAVYISTDESDQTFFEPLVARLREQGSSVYWLRAPEIQSLLKKALPLLPAALGSRSSSHANGPIEQLIAAQGRVMFATRRSTFSAYVVRLRGYIESNGGSLPESATKWLPCLGQSVAMPIARTWPYPPLWGEEWPLAWTGLEEVGQEPPPWPTHPIEEVRRERQRQRANACLYQNSGFAIDTERCTPHDGLRYHFTSADNGVLRWGAELEAASEPFLLDAKPSQNSRGPFEPVCRYKKRANFSSRANATVWRGCPQNDQCQAAFGTAAEAAAPPFALVLGESKDTWQPWAAPRGIDYLTDAPARGGSELGVDHVWLPVMRTHTMQDPSQLGVWMYYGRGCSDLVWDVGRTLTARNRCHAAILLEQRLQRLSQVCTWEQALVALARKLVRRPFSAHPAASSILSSSSFQSRRPPSEQERWTDLSKMSWALDACSRGYRVDEHALARGTRSVLPPCTKRSLRRFGLPRIVRSTTLNPQMGDRIWLAAHRAECQEAETIYLGLLTSNMLDYVSFGILRKLAGTDAQLDTVQLLQQPQGGKFGGPWPDRECGTILVRTSNEAYARHTHPPRRTKRCAICPTMRVRQLGRRRPCLSRR